MAYQAITKNRKNKVNMDLLWKDNIPPKLKLFLWLVWWERLPTNKLLHHQNIVQSALCPTCHSLEESTNHVLRECIMDREVWNKMMFNPSHNLSLEDWIAHHLQDPTFDRNIPMSYIFPFICWELWTQRNKHVFESTPTTYPRQHHPKSLKTPQPTTKSSPTQLCSKPPISGYQKLPLTRGSS